MNAPTRLFLVRNEHQDPAEIQLEFAHDCAITDSEKAFLSRFLAHHPAAQIIIDELAGQVRQRGRGKPGIKNPRALAALLAREATRCGTDYWYNWQSEAELRQAEGTTSKPTQPVSTQMARPETIAAARLEAQKIRERHAERRLQLQLLQGGKK